VRLGLFPAGTTIGWFVVANGYDTVSRTVKDTKWTVYSMPDLNPEASAALRQHAVLLQDPVRERLLLGFEEFAATIPAVTTTSTT